MFAGHLGAGLLLKRTERKVSLGWLFFGAMLLDILFWLRVLAGVESVPVPKNLGTMADLTFEFPYSHGLVASLGWSLVLFMIGCFVWRRYPQPWLAGALVLATAVFSHFALDWFNPDLRDRKPWPGSSRPVVETFGIVAADWRKYLVAVVRIAVAHSSYF